jgi:hypothetical protein
LCTHDTLHGQQALGVIVPALGRFLGPAAEHLRATELAQRLHLQYTCTRMVVIKSHTSTPPRVWQLNPESMYRAHERAYRRAGTHALVTIGATFQASPREIGEIFDVSRQAIDQWLQGGVPPNRIADVSRVADVARRLRRTFKRERIPAIVRNANPGLDGNTVLQTLSQPDGVIRVMDALDRLSSYVPAP